MHLTLAQLSLLFYVAAALIGAPAVVVLAWSLLHRFRARYHASPDSSNDSFSSIKNPDAILLMLQGLVRSVAALAKVSKALSTIVLRLLTMLALAAIAFAALLFLTARGLQQGQSWARIVAGILMGALLILSLGALSMPTLRRGGRSLLPIIVIVISIIALQVVWNVK